jgi:hypothetical protein
MTQQVEPGAGAAARAGQVGMETDQERKLKQYLEDERIALFLQNEEFMRELQRNREFLIALERGVHTHTNVFKKCIICKGLIHYLVMISLCFHPQQSSYEESVKEGLCHGSAFLLIPSTSSLVVHEGELVSSCYMPPCF